MTEEKEPQVELVQELLFELKCMVHGKDHITFHPRLLNLGHGKSYVEVGKGTCLKCGTSHWITVDIYTTKFERVPMRQLQAVVLDDMRKEMSAQPQPEREVPEVAEPQPEPSRAEPGGAARPAPPGSVGEVGAPAPGSGTLFSRPRFGG